jgi:hypothetical protein
MITVMYNRLIFIAEGRRGLEASLLGHTLAHEIGHILQGTDAHTPTGIMKARWTMDDFAAMVANALTFMPLDAERMRERIAVFRSRSTN